MTKLENSVELEGDEILHEAKRLRLIAAALELQHFTSTAANIVPIPSGDRVIPIGTPVEVRGLLAADAIPQTGAPVDAMSDDDLWQVAIIVNRFAHGSLWSVSEHDCITAIRARFMDPDSAREYDKAHAVAVEGDSS